MKKKYQYIIFGTVVLFLFTIDQILKYISASTWNDNPLIISKLFALIFHSNSGVAFGIPFSNSLLYLLVFLILGLLVKKYTKEIKEQYSLVIFSLLLIFIGAISNVVDRIIHGYVVDYINFLIWPVFNLADVYVIMGVLFILYYEFKPSVGRGKVKVDANQNLHRSKHRA